MSSRVACFPSLASMSANPYWALLAHGLRERGWEVDDEAAAHFGAHWLAANHGRVDVLHFHYVQQLYAYEHTRARLRWVLRFARNLLLARLWGYRIGFTLHDLKPWSPLAPRWVDYLGYWCAANLSNAVIVHCDAARSALRRRYGRRSGVFTVSHPKLTGLYPNAITRASARESLGLEPDSTTYLFFGGLRPNKGIELLCDAFHLLDDSAARLLIVGHPTAREPELVAMRDAAHQDARIRMIEGYVPNERIQDYMNAADVVVLPFSQVLTSSSVILAMGFGRPVVAPAMGCLPELVTEGAGLLYDPSDPSALARALWEIRTQDLNEMGRRARARVDEYTVDRFIDETLAAYEPLTRRTSVRLRSSLPDPDQPEKSVCEQPPTGDAADDSGRSSC